MSSLTGLWRGLFEYNRANLSGAIDIVVVRRRDGTYVSTPWHVRFGKLRVLRSREKRVVVSVNGQATELEMWLGETGEATFPAAVTPPTSNGATNDAQSGGDESGVGAASGPQRSVRWSWGWGSVPQRDGEEGAGEEEEDVEYGEWSSEDEWTAPELDGPDAVMSDSELARSWTPKGSGRMLSGRSMSEIPSLRPRMTEDEAAAKPAPMYLIRSIESDMYLHPQPHTTSSTSQTPSGSDGSQGRSDSEDEFFDFDDADPSPRRSGRVPELTQSCPGVTTRRPGRVSPVARRRLKDTARARPPPDGVASDLVSTLERGIKQRRLRISLCAELVTEDMAPAERLATFEDHMVDEGTVLECLGAMVQDPRAVYEVDGNFGPYAVAVSVLGSQDGAAAPAQAGSPTRSWTRWFSWFGGQGGDVRVHAPRTLKPTSEQLASLPLKDGVNRVSFAVVSQLMGLQQISASVYLWDEDAKIVVSDIDGTVTRSDIFGHILPILGKDWSHSGVAQLFTNVLDNGYKIIYLTSRGIGLSGYTRGYISTLRQEDVPLPEGPLFLSPDSLLVSINREIITRNPQVFKIACLRDIASLFPHNPFYAGFGNRPTDFVSYVAVGVPIGKVFTINPRGEITTTNLHYRKSYIKLNALVNEMFPPIGIKAHEHEEEFNDFQFWRMPHAEV